METEKISHSLSVHMYTDKLDVGAAFGRPYISHHPGNIM